ncbi:MAG: sigma factor-like helix-turn-helix DNA-binding protein [Pseudomonadota bacterium]
MTTDAEVLAVLDKLPEYDRKVLHLYYAECRPWLEIAALLRTSTEALKQINARACAVARNLKP